MLSGLNIYNFSNEDKKVYKSLCKKYLQKIPLTNKEKVKGELKIKNIRFYPHCIKVHIVFNGVMYGRYNRLVDWRDSSLLQKPNVSKIKVNRLLRRYTTPDIRENLLKLGIRTDFFSFEIYKVEWV